MPRKGEQRAQTCVIAMGILPIVSLAAIGRPAFQVTPALNFCFGAIARSDYPIEAPALEITSHQKGLHLVGPSWERTCLPGARAVDARKTSPVVKTCSVQVGDGCSRFSSDSKAVNANRPISP